MSEEEEILRRVRARHSAPAPKRSMGSAEAFGRGALQSVYDMGFGTKQLGAELGNMAGFVDDRTVERLRREQAQREQASAEFMKSGAGQAGYLAGSVGSLLIPGAALGRVGGVASRVGSAISAPKTLLGAATAGGVQGAIQPVAENQSRTLNTAVGAIGGIGGNVVARGVSRIGKPVTSVARPRAQVAARRLETDGVPVDIAEKTNSDTLRAVRRTLEDNPLTARQMNAARERTQEQFNRAVMKTTGENAVDAGPEVVQRAHKRIGDVMDDVAKRNKIMIDDQMLDDLARIEAEASATLNTGDLAPIRNQLNNILGKLKDGDVIDGKAYQRIRSNASKSTANKAIAPFANQLREAIDAGLQRSAGEQDAALISSARREYRNLMRVEDSIGTTELGDISIPKLAAATSRKSERTAALRDVGDSRLARLSRSANTMRDTFPNSGTAARSTGQALAGGTLAGLGAGAATFLTSDDPLTLDNLSQTAINAALGAGAYAGGMKGAAKLYNSPAFNRYLLNGLPYGKGLLTSPMTKGALTYSPVFGLLSSED